MSSPPDIYQKLRHDLRGKLNGILGSSQVLMDSKLTEDQRHFLLGIIVSGDEMLSVIDRISPDHLEAAGRTPENDTSIERMPEAVAPAESHTLLIVDDEIQSLDVLVQTLGKAGYRIQTAPSAEDALKMIQEQPPEIILLDLNLPGKSGMDLCRDVKSMPLGSDIPVIFLSGMTDIQTRLKAYESGGVDFIVKPFYAREVIVRVNTHLQLADARKKLQRYACSLESLVKERTEQLIHQDRMASLGTMSAGVVHEIKNPVTFIKGNIAILRRFESDLDRILQAVPPGSAEASKAAFIRRELPSLLKDMESGVERVSVIVESLKSFSRKDPSEKTLLSIVDPIEDALKLTTGETKRYQIGRQWTLPVPKIRGNAQQLSQAFVNLIVNAAHALGGKADGHIQLAVFPLGGSRVAVRIADNGCGMTPETLSQIWLPFFTTKPKGVGTGLGMPIVHGIIQDHGGQVRVCSQPGEGTVFEINFPVVPEGGVSCKP